MKGTAGLKILPFSTWSLKKKQVTLYHEQFR